MRNLLAKLKMRLFMFFLRRTLRNVAKDLTAELAPPTPIRIVETIPCPNCGHDIDIVLVDNFIDVIGGCVACDYMPDEEEVEVELGMEDWPNPFRYPEEDWREIR